MKIFSRFITFFFFFTLCFCLVASIPIFYRLLHSVLGCTFLYCFRWPLKGLYFLVWFGILWASLHEKLFFMEVKFSTWWRYTIIFPVLHLQGVQLSCRQIHPDVSQILKSQFLQKDPIISSIPNLLLLLQSPFLHEGYYRFARAV